MKDVKLITPLSGRSLIVKMDDFMPDVVNITEEQYDKANSAIFNEYVSMSCKKSDKKKLFLVFEGIDGSGKTTLSKAVAEKLGAIWTKEPTFTSEEADTLNLNSKDDIDREIEFCIDRIKHQSFIKSTLETNSLVCDRYIWSGLVYSLVFNQSAFCFAQAMYKHQYFIKPDYYILVDAPIDVCMERRQFSKACANDNCPHNTVLKNNGCNYWEIWDSLQQCEKYINKARSNLIKLRGAYLNTESLVGSKSVTIIVVNNSSIDKTVNEILLKIGEKNGK